MVKHMFSKIIVSQIKYEMTFVHVTFIDIHVCQQRKIDLAEKEELWRHEKFINSTRD